MAVFRIWLTIFGMVIVGISVAHLLVGQPTYLGGGEVNATMDSDLRFYNVLFAAYGAAFVWVARDVGGRTRALTLLNALFFAGGAARLLAWAASGIPSAFYVAMIPVELILPLIHEAVRRKLLSDKVPAVLTARPVD